MLKVVAKLALPQTCEASFKDRLCEAVTGFLDDKTAGASASAANCKENCGFIKNEYDLLKAAQKKANNSCAKGAAPDMKEIGKGLDKDTQNSLNNLYKQNSVLFDGVDPNLKSENFGSTAKSAATLTGVNTLSLKSYDPNINKVAPLTDFSLKKPTILLASAKTVKAAAQSSNSFWCRCIGTQVSFKTTGVNKCAEICCVKYKNIADCNTHCVRNVAARNRCACCKRHNAICQHTYCKSPSILDNIINTIKSLNAKWNKLNAKFKKSHTIKAIRKLNAKFKKSHTIKAIRKWVAEKDKAAGKWIIDIKRKIKGKTEKCDGTKYNPKKECCLGSQTFSRNKINKLSDCAIRYQIPDKPVKANGCGGKYSHRLVFDNPTSFFNKSTSFKEACDTHDKCYGNCKKFKYLECDANFYADMMAKCKNAQKEAYKKCGEMEVGKKRKKCENKADDLLEQCNDSASTYYAGVNWLGKKPYESAQKEYCSCCPAGGN